VASENTLFAYVVFVPPTVVSFKADYRQVAIALQTSNFSGSRPFLLTVTTHWSAAPVLVPRSSGRASNENSPICYILVYLIRFSLRDNFWPLYLLTFGSPEFVL
jgi:hypothetical protein